MKDFYYLLSAVLSLVACIYVEYLMFLSQNNWYLLTVFSLIILAILFMGKVYQLNK